MEVLLTVLAVVAVSLLVFVFGFLLWKKIDKIDSNNQNALESLSGVKESVSEAGKETSSAINSLETKTLNNLNKNLEHLGNLKENLANMTNLQTKIGDLSKDMSSFMSLLSGSGQARGSLGEQILESLVKSMLPVGWYDFQRTLSNGKKPDCTLLLPNPPGKIAIDSKFPTKSYERLEEKPKDPSAATAFKRDVRKHLEEIANKYIIPGETADFAMLFIPSTAILIKLQKPDYREVLDEAREKRVFLLSPDTFMTSLAVVQSVLRDVQFQRRNRELINCISEIHLVTGKLIENIPSARKAIAKADKEINDLERNAMKISDSAGKMRQIETDSGGGDAAEEGDSGQLGKYLRSDSG